MRIFKNKSFSRFARKEDISDDELKNIIPQLEENNADANLGGNVFKVRIARSSEGKRGSYRIIVLFRSGERTFFVEGYAKADLSNIPDKMLQRFKMTASDLFSFTEKELEALIKAGEYKEITEEKHEEVSR
jgi:hypothetical protein